MDDSMTTQPLGDRLRAARQRKGLSLRELASRVGVSASLLSQLENGKSQASVTTLHALVTALDITLDQLFESSVASPSEDAVRRSPEQHAERGPVYIKGDRP